MLKQLIVDRLQRLSEEQFNGKLDVKSNGSLSWSLYFCYGRLFWATGGCHATRRWQRYLNQHCPEISPSTVEVPDTNEMGAGQYKALRGLVRQQRVTQQQAIALITDALAEVLFDILQQASLEELRYIPTPQKILEFPLHLIPTEVVLKKALQAWESWQKLGLAKYSPNLAPVLRQRSQLQEQTSAAVYQNFVILINGKYTLRDLAAKKKQDVILLTRSLLPYIRQGSIGLVEVEDLPSVTTTVKAVNTTTKTPPVGKQELSPLVACVDDSPQTCQMIEQIFTQEGFRFVGIQNSAEALPILIQQKPDLIFLDLMMPVVNGYELCAQLRRVSMFANVPIVILTGSDGLVDRVRAKNVGATDFLSKPIEPQKLLAVPHQYLSFSLLSKLSNHKKAV